jgi:hypothetical protein
MFELLYYQTVAGKAPAEKWLEDLRDKSTQDKDILRAHDYWNDYRNEK